MKTQYIEKIPTTICGIPCLIGVTSYISSEPDSRADNPWDYYGYSESEYEILDRKGYVAAWLERKLDKNTVCRIESEIDQFFSN